MAGRAKNNKKLGVSDIAAAWRAGWSPSDVNQVLDRLEAIGDPTDPLPQVDEDEEIDDTGADNTDVPNDDQDDDQDEVIEDDANEEDDEDVKAAKNTLGQLKQTALEVENNRLKKEIQRLQSANRRKDLSGGEPKQSLENSLIDTFQSLFN